MKTPQKLHEQIKQKLEYYINKDILYSKLVSHTPHTLGLFYFYYFIVNAIYIEFKFANLIIQLIQLIVFLYECVH